MADKSQSVVVKGLPELARGFKAIEDGEKNALKLAFLPVAESAAGKVRSAIPGKSGRARSSVRAKSSNYGASVAAGGRAAPYYHWLDFGGSVGRGHVAGVYWSGDIIRRWEGVPIGPGRYIYPAISAERAKTAEAATGAIIGLARKAGFGTRG